MQLQPLTAGSTIDQPIAALAGYPAGAGWVLKVRLAARSSGGSAVTYPCVADGDAYRLQIAAAAATWPPGDYSWSAWVERAAERFPVGAGTVAVAPDPTAIGAGYDGRSQARRMLDAVEATLEGRATSATAEYEIAGRKMRYIPLPELLTLRDRLRADVAREDAAAAVAAGLAPRGRLYVRFGR